MSAFAILWFFLLILFIFLEASTLAVVSVWFAAGSLTAMVAALFGAPLWLQILLFVLVSLALLLALRPITGNLLKPKVKGTNLDAVIGSEGVVIEEISNRNGQGRVKLGGMEWSARSTADVTIPVGTQIKVDRIEGVKVFVSIAQITV